MPTVRVALAQLNMTVGDLDGNVERILAAYDEADPLADGWRQRTPLHQLHPLLVHAVLFGGGYGAQAGARARQALTA